MTPIESLGAFVHALPDWVPSPQISAQLDGTFDLDWMLAQDRILRGDSDG